MAKNVALPDDLVTAVEAIARAEGKTADELIEEATRRFLARQRLDSFVRRSEGRARDLGITEADVPKIVKQFRRGTSRALSGRHSRYEHLHLGVAFRKGKAPSDPSDGCRW